MPLSAILGISKSKITIRLRNCTSRRHRLRTSMPWCCRPCNSALKSRRCRIRFLGRKIQQRGTRSEEADYLSALAWPGLAPVRSDQITSHYGAVGVNINIPIFNGFYFDARAKTADIQTNQNRQRLTDERNNIAVTCEKRMAGIPAGLLAAGRNPATPPAGKPVAQPGHSAGRHSAVGTRLKSSGAYPGGAARKRRRDHRVDTDASIRYRLKQLYMLTIYAPK